MAMIKNTVGDLYNSITDNNKKFWDDFKTTLTDATMRIYQSDILNYMVYIHKDITETIATEFEKYIEFNLQQGINAKSINRKLSAVKSLINFLVKKNIMNFNPLSSITKLDDKAEVNKIITLTWEQTQKAKTIPDQFKKNIFNCFFLKGLGHGETAEELGVSLKVLHYHTKGIGEFIGVPELKYQDIMETRNKYFAKCPECGKMLETIESNWQFKDGRLLCKEC
jgi:hypothetical protein